MKVASSFLLLLTLVSAVTGLTKRNVIEAVSRTTDIVVDQLQWERNSTSMTKIKRNDIQRAEGYVYEAEIEIGGTIIPMAFTHEVSGWRYIDEESPSPEGSTLPPFQLAGPVEIELEDATSLRLAVPHDVDAGALDKVLLAEGATVTVSGAHEISLSKPIKLPLPLIERDIDSDAIDSFVYMSEQLKNAAKSYNRPPISFRVVRPTSLIASAPPALPLERLKVIKTSPGAVEITKQSAVPPVKREVVTEQEWLWPLPSVKSSDDNLAEIERTLRMLMGPVAEKKGSFNVRKARVYPAQFLKVEFELVRKLDDTMFQSWPSWQTKPTVQRKRFELFGSVDGDMLIPHSVSPLYPYVSEPTPQGWSGISQLEVPKERKSKLSPMFPPVSSMTL